MVQVKGVRTTSAGLGRVQTLNLMTWLGFGTSLDKMSDLGQVKAQNLIMWLKSNVRNLLRLGSGLNSKRDFMVWVQGGLE